MSTSAITPWQPNPAILQRMPQSCKQYQKWELLPTDQEVKFVQERFNQSKPHRYAIKTINYIHNPSHTQAFESELLNMEEEKFPPRWSEEPHQEWKKKAIERWQKLVAHDNSLKQAKVLFLWYGSAKCDSICSLGFTYFGKLVETGNHTSYYGSGIYFTNSAHYASTHGHLLLAAVSMRQPYPIINDCPHPKKGSSINLLEGKGAYQNYNAHFIPLEFAFVIEKETKEALEYFRTLSRLIQIQIINLGETKCEIFGPLEPSPTPNGFCMDTGGNIPIGGVFELIGTPQKLAQTQTSQWIDDNIILANVMNSVCLVAGESKLAAQYLKKKKEMQKLQKTREKLALRLLAGHLQEFSPNLTKEKEEVNAFGIKKELYRPIQEILSSLALLFKLISTNTSERIDELVKLQVFSSQGAANLKKAISRALDLRLEAHLFYKDETEYLYQIETDQPQDPQKLYLTPERVNTLKEIYKVLIPFCKATQEFYLKQDKKIFSIQEFYDQGQIVQAKALEKSLQYKEAQAAYQQAVSLDPNDIEALLYLGMIEGNLGNAAEELKRAQKALTLAKQKYGDKHPHVAQSLNNIGAALQALGKTEEGLTYSKQALEIFKALYGDKHLHVATSLNNIGFALQALGKTEEGLTYSKQALEIRKALYGDKHPSVAISLNNIGSALKALGKTEEGLTYYKQALEILKTFYGDKHPHVAQSLNNIGDALKALGKTEEGLAYLKQALEILKALYGDKHPDVATSLNNIGSALFSLGQLSEALTASQQALKICLEFYAPDHPNVQETQKLVDAIQSKLQQ
jgi:tetratricopeptide (TPR) repeat protein